MSETQEDHSKFALDDHVKDDTVKKTASEESCPICLHKIHDKVTLPICNHGYCKQCIDRWAKLKNECPVCRRKFSDSKCHGVTIEGIMNRFAEYDADLEEEDGLMQTGIAVMGLHYYMAQRFGRVRVPSHQLNSYILTRPDVLRRSLYR